MRNGRSKRPDRTVLAQLLGVRVLFGGGAHIERDDIAIVTASGVLIAASMLVSLRLRWIPVLLGVVLPPRFTRPLAEPVYFTMLSVISGRPQHHPGTHSGSGHRPIVVVGMIDSCPVGRGGSCAAYDSCPVGRKWEVVPSPDHRHRAEPARHRVTPRRWKADPVPPLTQSTSALAPVAVRPGWHPFRHYRPG